MISSSKGSYDNAPGGYFDTQNIIFEDTKLDEWYLKLIVEIERRLSFKIHSFIPIKSALTYTGNNVLHECLADKNRVCTGNTSFDSYYAPIENEEHIFLTPYNVDWLTQEMDSNAQPSSVYLTENDIKGKDRICINDTETYSLSSCKLVGPITWQVSNNLDIVYSTNSRIRVKTKNGITQGIAEIMAENENQRVVKRIYIGDQSYSHVSEIPINNIYHLLPFSNSALLT